MSSVSCLPRHRPRATTGHPSSGPSSLPRTTTLCGVTGSSILPSDSISSGSKLPGPSQRCSAESRIFFQRPAGSGSGTVLLLAEAKNHKCLIGSGPAPHKKCPMLMVGNDILVLFAQPRQGGNFLAQPDQFTVKAQQNPARDWYPAAIDPVWTLKKWPRPADPAVPPPSRRRQIPAGAPRARRLRVPGPSGR